MEPKHRCRLIDYCVSLIIAFPHSSETPFLIVNLGPTLICIGEEIREDYYFTLFDIAYGLPRQKETLFAMFAMLSLVAFGSEDHVGLFSCLSQMPIAEIGYYSERLWRSSYFF